jgi:hypothetical protein
MARIGSAHPGFTDEVLAWRPSREDETFALRHGMNPNGVAYELRHHQQAISAADGSTLFRDWVRGHAIEAPHYFPVILTGA